MYRHISVLKDEVIENLNIKEDGIYIDMTLGGCGHSMEVLKRLKTGKLIGIDRDIDAINNAKKILKDYNDKAILVHDNFKNISNILIDLENKYNIKKVDGVIFDLGVSSYQLDNAERGFSYMKDAKLDMRMNQSDSISAYEVVNNYEKEKLYYILSEYGEEKHYRKIVDAIITKRKESPIETTFELVELIDKVVYKNKNGHRAKKTFQAIRIEVNDELNIIKNTLENIIKRLEKNARLCVITFHSLEDKIVKSVFKELSKSCICPPEFPVCVCDKISEIKIINNKPILPSEEEFNNNSRSRSAKLRVVEKV